MGLGGAVARSGLHGRKPVFRSPRALAESYFDPYIDYTGCVTGYAVTHMRIMGAYDWRFSRRNVWAVENMLLGVRSHKIKRSRKRVSASGRGIATIWRSIKRSRCITAAAKVVEDSKAFFNLYWDYPSPSWPGLSRS